MVSPYPRNQRPNYGRGYTMPRYSDRRGTPDDFRQVLGDIGRAVDDRKEPSMIDQQEIDAMANEAKRRAGWDEDGTYRPLRGGETAEDRAYAEGVEAGLRWVSRSAGDPFPR